MNGIRGRLPQLPLLLGISGGLFVVAVVVGAVVAGPTGALGAGAGVLLVVASYAGSSYAIAWADTVNPKLVLPMAVGGYATKVALFCGLMTAVVDADWAGLEPMAAGIVAAVLAWTSAQVWWVTRIRVH